MSTRRCVGLALVPLLAAPIPALADVMLVGIDGPLAANALAHLDLDEEPCDAPMWRVQQKYRAAPAAIGSALQALGYYEATTRATLAFDEECWRAEFAVTPGEPVRIRNLEVMLDGEAAGDTAFASATSESGLALGEPLNHGSYERLKRRWSNLAVERGYPEARLLANRIDVYPDERVADVALHFDSGPRYRFGAIQFEQDVLRETLLRAYLPFESGDPYDNAELTDFYVALTDSGYFQTIDVRPLPADGERKEIPVVIRLTPAQRRLITYGVGFSTDTGPRLRFGRNNRRWNDRGHQFGVDAQLSPVTSEVIGNYRFPFGDPRSEWINFDLGLQRENTDTSESESLLVGARRVVDISRDWTRTQSLRLLVEDFEVADQIGRSRLLMPGIAWLRLRADNEIRPSRGSRIDLEVRGGSDVLGSDTSFAQVIAAGKWIWPLRNAARILVRSRAGATGKDQLTALPPSVRFFAGGDNSVRGYDFETLGPVDAAGEVIGGSSLITGSFEYEQPLRARWSLAFFVDSGNAFEGSTIDAKTGVGIGGRWQSPLGPIRIDLAHPLDDPTDNVRLHITLGPDL